MAFLSNYILLHPVTSGIITLFLMEIGTNFPFSLSGQSLLVLILPPSGLSLGTLVFPSPEKPTLPNSTLTWRVSPISVLG